MKTNNFVTTQQSKYKNVTLYKNKQQIPTGQNTICLDCTAVKYNERHQQGHL